MLIRKGHEHPEERLPGVEGLPVLGSAYDLLSPDERERLRVELESLDRHQRVSTASALSERLP